MSPGPAHRLTKSYNQGFAVKVSSPFNVGADYTYHDNFQLAQAAYLSHHPFAVSRQVYDRGTLGMARPSRIQVVDRGGAQLFDSGVYGYDGTGNITAFGTDRYTYDGAGRLVSGTVKQAGSTRREEYTYDAFDNLLTASRDGQPWASFTATAQNRVHHPGEGPARSWFYDVAGNLLRINKDQDSDAEIEMSYDALGMQNTFRRDHPHGIQFVVSVFAPGNRRLLTFEGGVGGGVRTYTLRDIAGKTLRSWKVSGFGAYESPSNPGAVWSFEKDYLYGPEGMFATRFASGAKRYFHADHLGTPRLITDAEGQVRGRHHYYPYGWEALGLGEDERHCKYTGHERDPHGGTDYMLGRTYAFPNYRFMSVDPGRDGWNLYGYGGGSPVNYTDPSGREVVYANDKDRKFYERAAARNSKVRGVLKAFGPGTDRKLTVRRGDPGKHKNGGFDLKASTNITAGGRPPADGAMRKAWEDAGGYDNEEAANAAANALWEAAEKDVATAVITLGPSADDNSRLHELGHVEQALSDWDTYLVQNEAAQAATTIEDYHDSDSERYAENFAQKAAKKDISSVRL